MSAPHTPGPWVVREHDDADTLRICDAKGDFALSIRENAQLIAAAPELLEALEGIMDHRERMGLGTNSVYDRARAAIAKATGQMSA